MTVHPESGAQPVICAQPLHVDTQLATQVASVSRHAFLHAAVPHAATHAVFVFVHAVAHDCAVATQPAPASQGGED